MKLRATLLAAACVALLSAGAAQAGDVTVNLTGVQARGGHLLVSLQTRDQYQQQAGFGEIVASPAAGTVTLTFRDGSVRVRHEERNEHGSEEETHL